MGTEIQRYMIVQVANKKNGCVGIYHGIQVNIGSGTVVEHHLEVLDEHDHSGL